MTDRAGLLKEESSSADDAIKLLYITGPGRTASTLLGNILNEVPGLFYVGELMDIWRIIHNGWPARCGCGEYVSECPVWVPVLEAQVPAGYTLQSFSTLVMEWLRSSFRARHTWSLLKHTHAELDRDPAVASYLNLVKSTYESLRAVTGARAIVDSSKAPAPAAGLAKMPGIKTNVVHMVRDPRAVAYAWRQPKAGLEQYGIVHSTSEWVRLTTASNAVVHSLDGSAMLLRYEDFVAEPAPSVAAILTMMGEDLDTNPVRGRHVTLGSNHSVHGNPDRFHTGEVEITPDVRWETSMPRGEALAVTALAYLFMRKYGYR